MSFTLRGVPGGARGNSDADGPEWTRVLGDIVLSIFIPGCGEAATAGWGVAASSLCGTCPIGSGQVTPATARVPG